MVEMRPALGCCAWDACVRVRVRVRVRIMLRREARFPLPKARQLCQERRMSLFSLFCPFPINVYFDSYNCTYTPKAQIMGSML